MIAVEGRVDHLGLEAHHAGERLGEVGVHALDGLAVGPMNSFGA